MVCDFCGCEPEDPANDLTEIEKDGEVAVICEVCLAAEQE